MIFFVTDDIPPFTKLKDALFVDGDHLQFISSDTLFIDCTCVRLSGSSTDDPRGDPAGRIAAMPPARTR